MYKRKTTDQWELWTNYGYGWECECIEDTRAEGRQRYKEYISNAYQLTGIKLVKKRVKLCSKQSQN